MEDRPGKLIWAKLSLSKTDQFSWVWVLKYLPEGTREILRETMMPSSPRDERKVDTFEIGCKDYWSHGFKDYLEVIIK